MTQNTKSCLEDFSGKAFEQLLRYCLKTYDINSKLYKKLLLKDYNFEIFVQNSLKSQIDLIVVGKTDRIIRVIECKWANKFDPKWLEQISSKDIKLDANYARMNVICHACKLTQNSSVEKEASKKELTLVNLRELF